MPDNSFEILLVEDNPHDAELTLTSLKDNKLVNRIHIVEDGEEALDFLYAKGKYSNRNRTEKPKLILLDLKLPKVDGMEVLEKIKADKEMKTIPVVVLTSSSEESDILKSYQIGVNSYIVKPVDFEKFTNSVSELGLYWLVLNQPPE